MISRIAFVIADLEREVRNLAPSGAAPELILPPGTFLPVVEEIASHFGNPVRPGITEYAVGNVLIRQGSDGRTAG